MIAAQEIEECFRLQMFHQIRFLKISQNSQETTVPESLFEKESLA